MVFYFVSSNSYELSPINYVIVACAFPKQNTEGIDAKLILHLSFQALILLYVKVHVQLSGQEDQLILYFLKPKLKKV